MCWCDGFPGGALEANPRSYSTVPPELLAHSSMSETLPAASPTTQRAAPDAAGTASGDGSGDGGSVNDLKWASEEKFSTVGCVVRDMYGNLASAGSTGGLCNKQAGRVGDTPIPGAGVYANSKTCAVACTGHGESFIKHCVAFDVHARMAYKGIGLHEAMTEVVLHTLPAATGGCVAVDHHGRAYAVYNTQGMFSGLADSRGRFDVWHKHDLGTQASLRASIVPDVIDKFDSIGPMVVHFSRSVGSVSKQLVTIAQRETNPLDGALMKTAPKVSVFRAPQTLSPAQQAAGVTPPVPTVRTLVMVSPDSPTHEDHVHNVQSVHWIVCNMSDQAVTVAGDVVLEYDAPTAPASGNGKRRYVFLLFTQPSLLDVAAVRASIGDTARFSTRDFAAQHKLTAISGTFTWAKWPVGDDGAAPVMAAA